MVTDHGDPGALVREKVEGTTDTSTWKKVPMLADNPDLIM